MRAQTFDLGEPIELRVEGGTLAVRPSQRATLAGERPVPFRVATFEESDVAGVAAPEYDESAVEAIESEAARGDEAAADEVDAAPDEEIADAEVAEPEAVAQSVVSRRASGVRGLGADTAAALAAFQRDVDRAARQTAPEPTSERPDAPNRAPSPAPAASHAHDVFDGMTIGLSEAKTYRLPEMDLADQFAALDRMLDAESEVARVIDASGAQVSDGLSDADLTRDLEEMGIRAAPAERTVFERRAELPAPPPLDGVSASPVAETVDENV